ncbi:hypothetical protein DITRI_Ditri10aG0163300 [Diplodiscus trichospermus]
MAVGHLAPTGVAKERAELYHGRLTLYVIIACIVAAVGGSIFGYDIGISGTHLPNVLAFILRRKSTNISPRSYQEANKSSKIRNLMSMIT